MGKMPYHLEKGHYLLLLEATLNEGIEAVVDDDAAITFPGLARRYSMLEYMREVVARPCDLTSGESEAGSVLMWPDFMTDSDVGFPIFRIIMEDWFGYRIRADGSINTKPNPNKPTGMWDGYQGNVERIIATVLVRMLEVSLGSITMRPSRLRRPHEAGRSTSSSNASSRSSEGWVDMAVPQCQSARGC